MKNSKLFAIIFGVISFSFSFVSCSDSDGNGNGDDDKKDVAALTTDEVLYSKWVADDLYLSALRLVANWGGATTAEQNAYLDEEDFAPDEDYGEVFINAGQTGNTRYKTVVNATKAIIAGCRDIIDEVAHSKIGAPYDGSDVNYIESPHSYNSIQDFYDNISGCLYALNGASGVVKPTEALDNSLMKYALAKYPTEAGEVKVAFSNALNKIKAMKAPFVKYYSDASAAAAIAALETLDAKLAKLSDKFSDDEDDAMLALINKTYVENVVRPTYEKLMDKTSKLQSVLSNMTTQQQLDEACSLWKEARQYWEWSEAFLFGPAHNLSIDPHIDTWPFDVTAFNKYMKNNSPLTDKANETIVKDAIRNGQNLTGFHALEYLVFRNGKNRSITSK